MADYHFNVFWSDEDGCYVADIPDLAFCSAFGDTPEGIREHLPELRRGKSYGCTRLIDGTRSRPRSKETTRSRSHTSAAAAR